LHENTETKPGAAYDLYSKVWLRRIRSIVQNLVVAIFFGLPVAVMALELVSPVGNVAIFVGFVSAASILFVSFFSDLVRH
jgi:hypothetical protein